MRRHDLDGRALGQHAMTDLAAAGKQAHARLTDAEGRKVVLEQKLLELHPLHVVHALLVDGGAEGRGDQGLGLAAGEQGAAMGPGQNADLAGDGTDVRFTAAVDAHFFFCDHLTHHALFDAAENLVDLAFSLRELFSQSLLNLRADILHGLLTLLLSADGHGLADALFGQGDNPGFQISVGLR